MLQSIPAWICVFAVHVRRNSKSVALEVRKKEKRRYWNILATSSFQRKDCRVDSIRREQPSLSHPPFLFITS